MTLLGMATSAGAHFLLNLNVRILHIEHLPDGLRAYIRTPMPYLVAGRVGPVAANGLPEPAPFTTNRLEEGQLVHYLDADAFVSNPLGLGGLVGEGMRLAAEGQTLDAAVEQVRVHRVGSQPGFATLNEARAVFTADQVRFDNATPTYVGDVVVDVVLRYRAGGPVYDYAVASLLDPGLPGQEDTANLILDYGPGSTKVFRARGLLLEPVEISRSAFSAVVTFVQEGVHHILAGMDHVLFVVCLVLGAKGLRSLLWRVTGFTLGHSVTLTAGFFGFAPAGAWFIPAVETGIALSIIYAAAVAVLPQPDERQGERRMFVITCLIGLLHGLGFSFVLEKILQVTSPDIWHSLLAFNLGVELGQLLIIIFAWPAFRLIEHVSQRAWSASRWGIGGVCAAIATVWTGQRVLQVIAAL